jgi:uncharacterized membrane protein YbaN (DUF454 family)
MNQDLIRPASPGNPACPAEPVKAVLAGGLAPGVPARGLRRVVLLGAGSVSLGTGIVGMFVPLLPTTCFLLLAAWCFGRSSPRVHRWMYENRWFGTYLYDYRSGRGIPRAVKIGSLSLLWSTIGLTVVFAVSTLWVRVALLLTALAITAHVATQRDAPRTSPTS